LKVSKNSVLFKEVKSLIVELRRKKNTGVNWELFQKLISENIEEICNSFNTRWLVSIADTYADYGNEIESRNAMLISVILNMEKLWATNLLIYDVTLNKNYLQKLQSNRVIPLWDGIYSFNINKGDMTGNLFGRIDRLMNDTPVIKKIYVTVLKKLKENDTVLSSLDKYHKDLFAKPSKRSILKIILRKLKNIIKQYKF